MCQHLDRFIAIEPDRPTCTSVVCADETEPKNVLTLFGSHCSRATLGSSALAALPRSPNVVRSTSASSEPVMTTGDALSLKRISRRAKVMNEEHEFAGAEIES